MFSIQFSKLYFLVEEMQLALLLATHAPDDFAGRTLARHILVRTRDFIAIARELRKPLREAGHATADFHSAKEALGQNFREYFQAMRDKLGAHVQDFDFGKRIEQWNDIEVSKLAFFVDGAREIYTGLAGVNPSGYIPWHNAPELNDARLLELLGAHARSKEHETGVELGADPLALTRGNASALLNTNPIHARAGQIVLIRRWIDIQTSLSVRLAAYPRIVRILKARVITDIVSLCDCLVTRTVSPGAPQEMKGLDALLTENGHSAVPVTDFVQATNFGVELEALRDIRNVVGAHLDSVRPLEELIALLEAADIEQVLLFYSMVWKAFEKLCFSLIFLRLYIADGERIHGVHMGRAETVPFSDRPTNAISRPTAPRLNDIDAYHENLRRWLDGDETQRSDGRQFFWQAFQGSEVTETIEEVEIVRSGSRMTQSEFRKAHEFVESMLRSELSDGDYAGVIDLILSCRNGWPYPLAELLVRHGRSVSGWKERLICQALGEIGSSPHDSADLYLRAHLRSPRWETGFAAATALFKTYVKSEGLHRVNNRGSSIVAYDEFVVPLTARLTPEATLIQQLAFASILSHPDSLSQAFNSDYVLLQAEIEQRCQLHLRAATRGEKLVLLRQLIQTHDYVGVCALIATELDDGANDMLRDVLLECCRHGWIKCARGDQAIRHLAMCFHLSGDNPTSLSIARGLALRNPDQVRPQLLVAQIMAAIPGSEAETAETIALIRRMYRLGQEEEAALAWIEQELSKRTTPR